MMEPVRVAESVWCWFDGLRWVVLTAGDLIEPEQGGNDTRFSSARPADDSNVLATLDIH